MIGRAQIKDGARTFLYKSGILGAIHRLRNHRALTVFMFHRVLPEESASYARAEREFTFTENGFNRCLEFIRRHYHPVSLQQVRQAASGEVRLPSCPALVTFDDGWRDTLAYAMPALRAHGIPAVLFLATEVIALEDERWWQDMLVEVLASPGECGRLSEEIGIPDRPESALDLARCITARLAESQDSERAAILSRLLPESDMPRQMLCVGDVGKLAPQIEVAGHGHSHGPLCFLSDPGMDLRKCHEVLSGIGAVADTISFPHGVYDASVVGTAREAGFEYMFSSDPMLVSIGAGNWARRVMGRIHIPENEWTCDEKGISFPKLATYLFFRKAA